MTYGINATLNTASDGQFLFGIRVEWKIKSEYLGCQFTTLRVELNPGQDGRDISVSERTVDFNNEQLDCNTHYTPRMRAVITVKANTVNIISKTEDGASLFYGGKTKQNMQSCVLQNNCIKGGIEGPSGPANAVPLSKAVCIAGPLFDQGHTHLVD